MTTVQPVILDAAGVRLSGLLATPGGTPRATIVALHGAGMTARYFDGPVDPELSLLTLGARLGMTVLALDRPGYGRSARCLPSGQRLADQVTTVAAAVKDFAGRHATGAGVVLLAHSFGGKLALALATSGRVPGLLGVDISGLGYRYTATGAKRTAAGVGGPRAPSWGPLRLYPAGTFRACRGVVTEVPELEAQEARRWPETFRGLAPEVRTPVRFTFAEYDRWWRQDEDVLVELRRGLAAAPWVDVERHADAGHNLSLGCTARAYHLRAIGFAEQLVATEGMKTWTG